ncbi:hypothetical protein HC752_18215 [Vibrio sp. S9_S30]|uniref:hypothetical protein n=1 Tax=Vibrio sp. S9_S30 TaxID=2720226 RepID=UPI0016804218|nr:hypothetical protein [Vibrio sp. S9_S30]MBD1558872.1 hypothetical protein [Vibrio sp. S9_S30]
MLIDNGFKPTDYMIRVNADHAFVVIGCISTGKSDDPKSWGDEAVVCDPWDGSAYHVSQIKGKMWGGGRIAPKSLCRVDSK